MDEIILASSSPRRRELLSQAGIPFTVRPADVDEGKADFSGSPEKNAEQLAFMKALDVAKGVASGLVLGADTIVVCDDEVFGKPIDEDDARRMLNRLNAREHLVITGIALLDAAKGSAMIGHETTKVRFARLTRSEIEGYISSGEPFDKAGSYAVQGKGALLVDGIEGCYTNVVGLPLRKLFNFLKEYGIDVM
ncbi:MAG: septum formation inhibitor Maf [Clostridiaceae bacterium]|jgi:septum formation protein|nr:septum formation inhibitor Maf [Clostridiaceae bacterium]